jgi:hypothetical protein
MSWGCMLLMLSVWSQYYFEQDASTGAAQTAVDSDSKIQACIGIIFLSSSAS